MSTPNQVLVLMRSILTDPNAWIKGEMARDAHHKTVLASSPQACRFCILGARRRADGPNAGLTGQKAMFALDAAHLRLFPQRTSSKTPFARVSEFNDHPHTTHEDVLKVIDEALTY